MVHHCCNLVIPNQWLVSNMLLTNHLDVALSAPKPGSYWLNKNYQIKPLSYLYFKHKMYFLFILALNFEGKFHQVGGKIFATNGEQADFEASKLTCKKAGGRIATPMNEAENSALLSILKEQNKYAYLGVTEGVIPSIYLYLDGTPLSYSNWRKNEPNGKGKEKCVEMFTDGQWNDKACNQNRLTVCEF
uniref:C-type lectin domain-containing protein n=1 Tax=Xenopus tropicalis TaxID=8364 RepID=A0A6I8QR96_XENTR